MGGITRQLTRAEVPDGSIVLSLSDVHVPHHDEDAVKLIIECAESVGVTHVFELGDNDDCGPASRHEGKRQRSLIDEGSLRESVAAGLWIHEWARTRPCYRIRGNHEGWVENYIAKSPECHGSTPESLMGLWEDGDGWEVLPNFSRLRLGNRVWEHGNGFFPSGSGGQNPGARIRSLAPDQTTSVGHLHREFMSAWSTPDENGTYRTRSAIGQGHLSRPEAHEEYAGSYLNWQQGALLDYVWYDGDKPRWTSCLLSIHRTKRGRPVLSHNGKVHR